MMTRLSALFLLFAMIAPNNIFAQSVPLFEIFVPGEIEIRTSNNSIGQTTGSFGWLTARGDTLSAADLQRAVFTGAVNDANITSVVHEFEDILQWAPILPGEVAGSRFSENAFNSLLLPGETRKTPLSDANAGLITLGFSFPSNPPFPGSSFLFEGSLTIRGETVNYSTDVTISRANASSSSIVTNPQRLASASVTSVPEPSSAVMVAFGMFALGATRFRRSVTS